MSITPTGRIVRTSTGHDIVIERTFNASIDDVWASLTEPERMNRWIGTWSGDPAPGKRITFRMTAEGEDAQDEDVLIHACHAPMHFDVESFQAESSWRLKVNLAESDGVTTLVFIQNVAEEVDSASYGVGWEYYLDRLVATMDETAFAEWDDYYPAQLEYWQNAQHQAYASDAR
jgi:uncharacterized protein YndB with AHSA1/START domain